MVCCEVLPTEISQTGRYTNVVCCALEILHSEQNLAQVQRLILFGANAVRFFLSCFSFPRFVVWPLELGLGTHNPRFAAWPLEVGLGTHNPRFVARPLELGLGTRKPRFVAWPLELELRG